MPNFTTIAGKSPTPSGRTLFTQGCFTPKKTLRGDEQYSIMLAFKKSEMKDSPEFQAMKDALNEAAQEQFKVSGYNATYKGKPLNSPFKTHDDYKYVAPDEVAIRLSTKFKPEIISPDKKAYLKNDDEFYSGCQARALYSALAYDPPDAGNRGVKFQLEGLQMTGHGERFQGDKRDSMQEFEAVDVEPAPFDENDRTDNEQDF